MKLSLLRALACLALWAGVGAQAGTIRKWCGDPLLAHGDEEQSGQIVSLSGILVTKPERGPPGWGETPKIDSRWTAWFIKLDYATPMIVPNLDSPASGLRTKIEYEIQVRGKFEFDGTYKNLKGKHVLVTGPLGQGAEPSNLGDAQLETTEIKIVGPTGCDGKMVQ
jgi:hypothetical protein